MVYKVHPRGFEPSTEAAGQLGRKEAEGDSDIVCFCCHLIGERTDLQVHPRGFEPLTFGSVDRCSIQLS